MMTAARAKKNRNDAAAGEEANDRIRDAVSGRLSRRIEMMKRRSSSRSSRKRYRKTKDTKGRMGIGNKRRLEVKRLITRKWLMGRRIRREIRSK